MTRTRIRSGAHRATIFLLAATLASTGAPAAAQQYITDDAAITEFRACQIQMWHGERSSWVLPVHTPMKNTELSLGFIALWKDGADGHFEYAAQLKTVMRALVTDGWGAGFVFGTGPRSSVCRRRRRDGQHLWVCTARPVPGR